MGQRSGGREDTEAQREVGAGALFEASVEGSNGRARLARTPTLGPRV